jgi:hypothetical protein
MNGGAFPRGVAVFSFGGMLSLSFKMARVRSSDPSGQTANLRYRLFET